METFRGTYQATIDDKGRLKLPARVKALLEQNHGGNVFVTSLAPHELRVYPLTVWEEIERRFLARPSMDPLVQRFLEHANYGQEDEVDSQGRVLVPQLMRDILGSSAEVVVSGRGHFLAVVLRERATAEIARGFSTEELAALALLEQ
ncbi:MAG: division/cell wall cluster transcriptional repressor MraZ [Acidobacteria bacterium]|nr:division/cell wall cluster transcriptional repressor MraZ [Acidobacteriota bacterium]